MKRDVKEISLEGVETPKLRDDESVQKVIESFGQDRKGLSAIWHDLKWNVKRFVNRVKTVWAFAKLGYDDFDWDDFYLKKVIAFKLERMYKFFSSDRPMCADAEKRAAEIKIALDACNRLLDNNYEELAFEEHNKKWGELEISFEKKLDSTGSYLHHHRANVKTEEDEKQEHDEFVKAFDKAEEMCAKDEKLLYTTLMKYERGWWD